MTQLCFGALKGAAFDHFWPLTAPVADVFERVFAVVGVLANNPGGVGAKMSSSSIADGYSRMMDRGVVSFGLVPRSAVCCWRGSQQRQV